jgi:DNA-binding NtrC family response regulator
MEIKYSVLIVDDDPMFLPSISNDVKKQGYSVTAVDSGIKALSILKLLSPDLIITDMVMEPVNGIEVLKKAKEIYPKIQVIILTGHGDMRSAVEALRADADDYVSKPYSPEELLFRIKRCLEKVEMQRQINVYENIVPICCVCKKIRDDAGKEHGAGDWISFEKFLVDKQHLAPSHTYCPECMARAKKEWGLKT